MDNIVAYARQELNDTVIFEPFFDMQRRADIDELIDLQDDRVRDYKKESRCRSVSTLKEYIVCNPWDGFITLTLSPKILDRYSVDEVGDYLTSEFNNYRTNYDSEFKFIIIPEYHSDNALHFHGFVKFGNYVNFNHKPSERFKYAINTVFLRRIGINRIAWFRSKYAFKQSLNYALKYATKSDKAIFKTLYRCSRGLKKYKRIRINSYSLLNRILSCSQVRKYQCTYGVLYYLSNTDFNNSYFAKIKPVLTETDLPCPFDEDLTEKTAIQLSF